MPIIQGSISFNFDGPLLYMSQKITSTHLKILIFSLLGWIFDFYDLILYSFLMIPIKADFGLTDFEVALIYGFSLLISAVGGIFFGYFSDKFGRRTTLIVTIFTYSAGTLLCSFSSGVMDLLLYRAITGFGVGGEWAVAQSLINETFPPNMKGRVSAILQSGAPIGVGISAVIGGYVMSIIGWRASFLYSAIPSFIIAILALKFLPESDLWIKHKILADGGNFRNFNVFEGVKLKFTALGITVATFGMLSYWLIFSWLPTYLSQYRGLDISTSGLWLLVSQVGAFVGYLTFGLLSDKIGRRPAFSLFSILQALGVVFLTFLWFYGSISLIWIFLLGVGTGFFSGYGPLYSEIFPTRSRSTLSGLCFNFGRGASFFAPILVAVVANLWGFESGLALAILFNVLLALTIWAFPETKGKVLDEAII
ncbi:MAG: MFS transporter [Candidatus Asgardarchaeia archaeon]